MKERRIEDAEQIDAERVRYSGMRREATTICSEEEYGQQKHNGEK